MYCMLKNIQKVFSRGSKILIKCGSVFSRVCAYSFVTLFFRGFPVLHFPPCFYLLYCSVAIVVLSGCFLSYLVESLYGFVFSLSFVFISHTGSNLVLWSLMYRPNFCQKSPKVAKICQKSPKVAIYRKLQKLFEKWQKNFRSCIVLFFLSALYSLVILVVVWFCGLSCTGPTYG
eukprot:SAG11_NODE_590_length_8314_cov_44.934388_4_plen_174_part_00